MLQFIFRTYYKVKNLLNYERMFEHCSTEQGSKFTLNYSKDNEDIVKKIIETYKDSDSNIVEGKLV